jgi:hypothetical protein
MRDVDGFQYSKPSTFECTMLILKRTAKFGRLPVTNVQMRRNARELDPTLVNRGI